MEYAYIEFLESQQEETSKEQEAPTYSTYTEINEGVRIVLIEMESKDQRWGVRETKMEKHNFIA